VNHLFQKQSVTVSSPVAKVFRPSYEDLTDYLSTVILSEAKNLKIPGYEILHCVQDDRTELRDSL
jgi:hypothetical protein